MNPNDQLAGSAITGTNEREFEQIDPEQKRIEGLDENPEDYQATISAQAAAWGGTRVTVVADARVSRGGCRIDSDFGALGAGVDAQILELAHALLGEAVAVTHGSAR